LKFNILGEPGQREQVYGIGANHIDSGHRIEVEVQDDLDIGLDGGIDRVIDGGSEGEGKI
jgi:hypothetical protein